MTATEQLLREAMARETEDLYPYLSMDDVRARARRRSVARAAGTGTVAIAVAAAVGVPIWAGSGGSAPNGAATAPAPVISEAADGIHTGIRLSDGRELLIWRDGGRIVLGSNGPGGRQELATVESTLVDWVSPHPVFGSEFHVVTKRDQSLLVIGASAVPVARIVATVDGADVDVPIHRLGDAWVFWFTGPPAEGLRWTFPPMRAYDDAGAVIDSLP